MTRTPDEIKKGLECCGKGLTWNETCGTGCPYMGMYITGCSREISADALALIQQLEAQNAELSGKIGQLEGILQEAKQKVRDLIVKVDKHGDDLNTTMVEFNNKIRQLEAERDAAVEDLQMGVCCGTCAYDDTDVNDQPCATCARATTFGNWEWRGVQKEE